MQQERQARHGWSEQERQALFLAAEQAMQEHIPIKRVFEHFGNAYRQKSQQRPQLLLYGTKAETTRS